MSKSERPSAVRLNEAFRYDPITGVLTRDGRAVGWRSGQGRHLSVNIDGVTMPVHVIAWVIMTDEYPDNTIDHANRDGTDNRWRNLREATQSQQNANRRCMGESGIRGVRRQGLLYEASYNDGNGLVRLGKFRDPAEAAAVVQAKRLKRWGEFAKDTTG